MNAVIFSTLMYKQVMGPALTQGSHKDVYGRSEGHRGHLWPHYTESYFRRCWEEQPSWFVCPYSRAVYTLKNMLPPLKNTIFSSILCEFHTMGCFPWIVSEGCFRDPPPKKNQYKLLLLILVAHQNLIVRLLRIPFLELLRTGASKGIFSSSTALIPLSLTSFRSASSLRLFPDHPQSSISLAPVINGLHF